MDIDRVHREGVDFIANGRRVIIGDDRGLGKTRQALLGLRQTAAFPAVVIAPAGHVKTQWAREAAKWTPGITVHVHQGGRPTMLRHAITVISYTEAHTWAPVIPHGYRGLVLDEGHRIKNATSRQSRAVLEIASKAHRDATMIVLTGTLAPNGRNGEVVRVLRAIRRLEDVGGTQWVVDATPGDLHRRLSEICYIRRVKDGTLPPRSWEPLWLTGDETRLVDYREREETLAALVGNLDGATDTDLARLATEHRGALAFLAKCVSSAKLTEAKEWVKGFRDETGQKIVVFATSRTAVTIMANMFDGARIQGGQSMRDRTATIDRFQNHRLPWGISCNMAAAGEGIDLTAASDVLFLELPWTPGGLDQCLDRTHRLGQGRPVIGWVAMVPGTVDEDMWELLQRKRAGMDLIQDGVESGDGFGSIAGGVLARVTARHTP